MRLISPEHAERYRQYYASREVVSRPSVWLSRVEDLALQIGAESIIDYGCGAARGISRFSCFDVVDYDPGVPGCEVMPEPADLVVSIHALEHVEPGYVDPVIENMKALARVAVFIVVSCETSTKTLADGTPWHSFVRDVAWWQKRLDDFEPQPVIKHRPGAEYAALKRMQTR
jgi:hypothetical protein